MSTILWWEWEKKNGFYIQLIFSFVTEIYQQQLSICFSYQGSNMTKKKLIGWKSTMVETKIFLRCWRTLFDGIGRGLRERNEVIALKNKIRFHYTHSLFKLNCFATAKENYHHFTLSLGRTNISHLKHKILIPTSTWHRSKTTHALPNSDEDNFKVKIQTRWPTGGK